MGSNSNSPIRLKVRKLVFLRLIPVNNRAIIFIALLGVIVLTPSENTRAQVGGFIFDGSTLKHRASDLLGLTAPNLPSDSSELQDPLAVNQRHFGSLKYFEALNYFYRTGQGIQQDVIVAVLDTGLDLTHPDLKDNLWSNIRELAGKPGIDDDQNGYIDDVYGYDFGDHVGDPSHKTVNDHGTHVAGLVGAVGYNGIGVSGVMGRRIRIMPLNVFGRNWSTDLRWISEAIRYAVDNGAKVINLSVGGAGNDLPTLAAIQYAENKGALVVVAAGNLSKDIETEFYTPASYAQTEAGVLSVAALDVSTGGLCGFSSYSKSAVQISAPGCDAEAPKQGLLSTRGQNQGGFGYKQGTSMAAPLVSGAAALVAAWGKTNHGEWPSSAELKSSIIEASRHESQLSDFISNGNALDLEQVAKKLH